MPDIVSNALQSFQKMKASTEKLAECQEQAVKVKNAAGKTAEAKFQSILNQMLANGTDPVTAQEGLDARKKVLEKWVATRRDQADAELKDVEMEHNVVRDSFEKVVAELVTHSHREYKSIAKRPKEAPVLFDESALFKELDVELSGCFDEIPPRNALKQAQGEQLEPPAMKLADDPQIEAQKGETAEGGLSDVTAKTTQMTQVVLQEPPVPNTVTGAYEAMKEAIDKVAEKSNIPPELKDSLMGSVHQCVKSTLAMAMQEGDRPSADGAPGDPKVPNKDGPSQEPAPSGHLPAPLQGEGSNGQPIVIPDGPGNGGLSAARAVQLELHRKDTSQLALGRANTMDLEAEELAKCAVPQEDGTVLYQNKKGKLETLEEREKRLAHNSYVAFSRSFEGLSIFLH